MILKIQVRGQVMKPLIKNVLANHSQEFSRFVFFLSDDWDGLTTFAQFRQGDAAYNVYLDSENACYLPPEIAAGKVSLMLYGTGEDVIGTTNAITMCVSDNKYVSDAQSTEITESLYQQLVNEVRAVIPSGGTVGQVLTRAANGKTAWSDAGTPTQEQITAATDAWLEENVAQETGYVLDSSLTMDNAAPPASAVGDLKSAIETLEAIPTEVKRAMDTLFSKAIYADDAASSYATFHVWATANPVTSIAAVFTQGSATIYDTDSLDTLKQYLTVTATYADSTTATVTDYTLSGTLAAGTSIITVSYGGKNTTFSVLCESILYPLANGSFTFSGNYNQKITISNGRHIKIEYPIGDPFANGSIINLSSLSNNGSASTIDSNSSAVNNLSSILFTIPANSNIELAIENLNHTRSEMLSTSGSQFLLNFRKTGASTSIISGGVGFYADPADDKMIVTGTIDAQTSASCLFLYEQRVLSGITVEFDISLRVNGVKWI